MLPNLFPRPRRERSRGQSLVEFALILPIVLLFIMMAIDFGRVFLGWVTLNNAARIAANYAAVHPTDWSTARYAALIRGDAQAANCTAPWLPNGGSSPPAPSFTSTNLGGLATVSLTCNFRLITPIVSSILGNDVPLTATAVFPVRTGIINTPASGGGISAPVAGFTGSPLTGTAPLTVTFVDTSTGSPTNWAWDFNGDGAVDSSSPGPVTWTYTNAGSYSVSLTTSNPGGTTTMFRGGYVTVDTTPPGAPVAAFTATPTTGAAPLTVAITNTTVDPANPVDSWSWDFGDGRTSASRDPGTVTYNSGGTYVISLTATNSEGASNATATINVSAPCFVPTLVGLQSNKVLQSWAGAGFTSPSNVTFNPSRPPEYRINSQSPSAGTALDCALGAVTVSK